MDDRDIEILRYYAKKGNRELYWNYLANLPGSDGYGLLALGVVRNDNMPGRTANAYAQAYARRHSGKVLTEREWNDFGIDLMQRDFQLRKRYWGKNEIDNVINLPALKVKEAHDEAFNRSGIDPDAWTPRKLLEAAHERDLAEAKRRAELGMPPADARKTEVESLWSSMLDNGYLGISRAGNTLGQAGIDRWMSPEEQEGYLVDMADAYLTAARQPKATSANIVDLDGRRFFHQADDTWIKVDTRLFTLGARLEKVTDPETVRQLDDTRQLRLEREAAREAFHPDDPRQMKDSPHPLADRTPTATFPKPGDDPVYASIRLKLPLDVSDDKAAEVAARVRDIGVHAEDTLRSVEINDGMIVCRGVRPGTEISVSMETPAPPREMSMQVAMQSDEAMFQQMQAMELQQSQQMAMQRSGPVMRH